MATKAGKLGSLDAKPAEKKVFFLADKPMRIQLGDLSMVWAKRDTPLQIPDKDAERLVAAKRGKIVSAPAAPKPGAPKNNDPKAEAKAKADARKAALEGMDAAALVELALGLGAEKKDTNGKKKAELVALVLKLEAASGK